MSTNNHILRYHCDPSGTFIQYRAKAIGAASEGAQNALQEQYNNVSNYFITNFYLEFILTLLRILL